MADIFLGIQLDQRVLERFVAIKKIHSVSDANPEIRAMFADEARIISTLNHPHVVQIFDFTDRGESFLIIMEYIDGENLGYILNFLRTRNERIPLHIGMRLMIQALEALQYIHNATSLSGDPLHIIHRDLDPRNLMLDSNGYLKIIDFGVAKAVVQTELTAPDLFKGKLSHVAPEVFTQNNIDHRADIYSIGLVLFEIATGDRPYRYGKSPVMSETIKSIIESPLPNPAEINPELPQSLVEIIQRACSKDREQRYQTADDLHAALTAFASHSGYGCGIASNAEVRQWFHAQFQDRLAKRRNFENRALQKAKKILQEARNTRTSGLTWPAPDGERSGIGSYLSDIYPRDGRMPGIDSVSGAPILTGQITNTPHPGNYIAPTMGLVKQPSAGDRITNLGGIPLSLERDSETSNAMPGPSGAFNHSLVPPATGDFGADDSVDTFSGSPRNRILKVSLAAVGVFAATLLIVMAKTDFFSSGNGASSMDGSDESVSASQLIVIDQKDVENDSGIGNPSKQAAISPTPGLPHTETAGAFGVDDGDGASDDEPDGENDRASRSNRRSWAMRRGRVRRPEPRTSAQSEPSISEDMEPMDEVVDAYDSAAVEMTPPSKIPTPLSDSESRLNTKTETTSPSPATERTSNDRGSAVASAEVSDAPRYISGSGSWSGPQVAQRGCGSCHQVDATSKTQSQWRYFFSHNRHRQNANLRVLFSKGELQRVESHLIGIVNRSKNKNSGIAGVR
jgi:serine/threonine protein kinase